MAPVKKICELVYLKTGGDLIQVRNNVTCTFGGLITASLTLVAVQKFSGIAQMVEYSVRSCIYREFISFSPFFYQGVLQGF